MSRFLPLVVVLAALAIAAPAQAAVTSSTITSPADPHFVLVDHDAPPGQTLSVSGTAAGTGTVDIVCERDGRVAAVLARLVGVQPDGTFSASLDVSRRLRGPGPTAVGGICRLRAVPDGFSASIDFTRFTGPRLGVSRIGEVPYVTAAGTAINIESYAYAAGLNYAAEGWSFGRFGFDSKLPTGATELIGSGVPEDDPDRGHFGVEVDGQAAYPPAKAASGIGRLFTTGDYPGLVSVKTDVVSFSPDTGDLTTKETDPLVTCGLNNAYPPTATSCTEFMPAPVVLERTTEYSHDAQVVKVTDRWSSTDGRPHRLDLSLVEARCFGITCSTNVVHRLPGETRYAARADGSVAGPLAAGQQIASRDAGNPALGGTTVVLGQRADRVRFPYNGRFVLDYGARTIPASGALTISHTYVTSRVAPDAQAVTPTPHGSPAPAPQPAAAAAPVLTRHGHVRVRHNIVKTRDWVHCATACVVSVRGARITPSQTSVAAGATERVAFRLTRRGVRVLTRERRLRLTVHIAATAGTAAPVTAVRRVTLRLPRRVGGSRA